MASTSPPPVARRRFAPQPVETSTRSSKRQHVDEAQSSTTKDDENSTKPETMSSATKPRRFLPQPIEETTKSSRRKNKDREHSPAKDASTDNVQSSISADQRSQDKISSTPSAASRRFAPEPVETTTRTSRRKFAIQPVETSTSSSKDKKKEEANEKGQSEQPKRRFAPQPVETTTSSSRRRRRKDQDEDSSDSPPGSPSDSSSVSSRQSTGSRKFSPDLIETAKGSYRHRKDSEHSEVNTSGSSSPPLSRSATRSPEPSDPPESRFSAASLAKRCHEEHRRHSYCVPNLPIIESESSSDESSAPSITELSASTENDQRKLAKIEESNKEAFSDPEMSIANSHDRKRLQDQVMAAYVNERHHEPVSHFAADEEEDEDDSPGTMSAPKGIDPRTFRRQSQADHDWEMLNMRKHHEQLERAKKTLMEDTAGVSRFSAAALASRHHLGQVHKPAAKNLKPDEDSEFSRMKKAASPPMLGDDLVFPYTVSPKMTRCDVDQAPRPRRADSDDDFYASETSQSLWSAKVNVQNSGGAGLWMGLCQKPAEQSRPTTPIRSGIQTPAYEATNPYDAQTPRGARTPGRKGPRPFSGGFYMAMTSTRSIDASQDEFVSSIDKKLQLEKQIEEEFSPRVITQIYNYLSLGFPSLARDFDAELSKISRISIKELRKDDDIAKGTIKGHVGCPEAEGTWDEDEDGTVRGCRRWDALRLYVKEWARQSPNFASEQVPAASQDPALAHLKSIKTDAWGATARRGSWAN